MSSSSIKSSNRPTKISFFVRSFSFLFTHLMMIQRQKWIEKVRSGKSASRRGRHCSTEAFSTLQTSSRLENFVWNHLHAKISLLQNCLHAQMTIELRSKTKRSRAEGSILLSVFTRLPLRTFARLHTQHRTIFPYLTALSIVVDTCKSVRYSLRFHSFRISNKALLFVQNTVDVKYVVATTISSPLDLLRWRADDHRLNQYITTIRRYCSGVSAKIYTIGVIANSYRLRIIHTLLAQRCARISIWLYSWS